MGATPGFIGCLEASEAIKIIAGCDGVLRNRLFVIDALTMESQTIEI